MTPELVMEAGQQTLLVTSVLILIVLVPSLMVGLLISMFQAATQINEQTLSFLPKLLIALAVMATAGPWMLDYVMDFTLRQYHSIPYVIG
ncbi:MAG: flagellar biosynthetic protein FliQ [Gammaproteobacteria bacterium]|nr:flagellar biosynthetic protein FliQ [Gammaproteobacteria bacterium]